MIRPFFGLWAILVAVQFSLPANAAETTPLLASVLENNLLRLRVEHLTGNFPTQWLAAQPTNKPSGVILDLRSADGENNSATAAGGLFADKKFPLVILVNGQTRGAAATLAADLRTAGGGILVGSPDFTGAARPDIAVTVAGEDEKKFLADPFFNPAPAKAVSLSATNEFFPFVDHTSEADLVRKRVKDGEEDTAATARSEPGQPVIRDPALARAVDLLKALAVLHPARG
jgi:hypothetical protein